MLRSSVTPSVVAQQNYSSLELEKLPFTAELQLGVLLIHLSFIQHLSLSRIPKYLLKDKVEDQKLLEEEQMGENSLPPDQCLQNFSPKHLLLNLLFCFIPQSMAQWEVVTFGALCSQEVICSCRDNYINACFISILCMTDTVCKNQLSSFIHIHVYTCRESTENNKGKNNCSQLAFRKIKKKKKT